LDVQTNEEYLEYHRKMKKRSLYLSLILCIFQSTYTYSQWVSVELSVKWDKGFDLFKEDSAICLPKLCITYRNCSDTNFYFLNVSTNRSGLPLTWSEEPSSYEDFINPNYLLRAKSYSVHDDQSFNVFIENNPRYKTGWIIFPDTANLNNPQYLHWINDNLTDIHEYIYRRDVLKHNNKYRERFGNFRETEIIPDSILKNENKRFVFLKPGEYLTDTYNIIGFQLVKGTFTFLIEEPISKDFVFVGQTWDMENKRMVEIKAALPKQIGIYKLYSGCFNTNKITVCFNDR
jgi:hypothetical protein